MTSVSESSELTIDAVDFVVEDKDVVDIQTSLICKQCQVTAREKFGKAYQYNGLCKKCNGIELDKQRTIAKKEKEEYNLALESRKVYEMNISSSNFIIVDTSAGLLLFEASLQHCILAGLDTETRPMFQKGVSDKNPTALLQIAMRCQNENTLTEKVFIIDLLILSQDFTTHNLLRRVLLSFFANESIIKLGQGLDLDIKELIHSYPHIFFSEEAVVTLSHVLEVSDLHDLYTEGQIQKVKVSLQRMTFDHLDKKLLKSKKLTLSNWNQRPLTNRQLKYAACDALVLIHIFDHLSSDSSIGNVITEKALVNLFRSFKFDHILSSNDEPSSERSTRRNDDSSENNSKHNSESGRTANKSILVNEKQDQNEITSTNITPKQHKIHSQKRKRYFKDKTAEFEKKNASERPPVSSTVEDSTNNAAKSSLKTTPNNSGRKPFYKKKNKKNAGNASAGGANANIQKKKNSSKKT